MTTKPLLSETALTLKALCSSCGLQKNGTKPVLVQRLRHAAKQSQPIPSSARILSIDLGLKNFAFSLISPAPTPKKQPPTSNDNDTPLNSPIRLHAWHRLDLTLPSSSSSSSTTTTTTTTKKKPTTPTPPAPSETTEVAIAEEEAFSPTALAALTTHLIKTHLLPLRPTHVLIERQRFRSAGAATVHEWTLRVNSLEAMLHAAFAALRGMEGIGGVGSGSGSGGGSWEGRVESVQPKMVAGFLFPVVGGGVEGGGDGDGEGGKKKGKNAAYTKLKREKVAMLGGFLEGGGMVVPEKGQAKEMVRLFVEGAARKGKGGGRKKVAADKGVEGAAVEEMVTKIDDLSDAVLQGMVWLQWRRNLEKLIKERPELLEKEE